MVVVTRYLPDDAASVPERSMAELLCQPELLGELGRLVEVAFGRRSVAGSRQHVTEREKEVAACRVVSGKRQRQVVQTCCLLERQR